jgi:hypothetical protein
MEAGAGAEWMREGGLAHDACGQTGHVSACIGHYHEPIEATGTLDIARLDARLEFEGWFKEIVRRATGEDFPQDPAEQLQRAIRAVFDSWNVERARVYRWREHIPDDLSCSGTESGVSFPARARRCPGLR